MIVPAETTTGTFTVTAAASGSGSSTITVDPTGAALVSTATVTGGIPECTKGQIVISQVYGAGGNTGAAYKNDFVELFNRNGTTCKMTSWGIQYATGSTTTPSNLFQTTALNHTFSGTIAGYGYFLIGEAGGTNGVALPATDATGGLNFSGTTFKLLVVSGATPTTAAFVSGCPTTSTTGYIDLVDFGAATVCGEGTPQLTTIPSGKSAVRNGSGCADTDNNTADFSFLAIPTATTPRNTATSPKTGCP
jgi:hypothetical protein